MSAVLTAAMVLSVAGCSSQPAQSPSAETTTTAAETTAAETTEAETTAAETEAEKTGAVKGIKVDDNGNVSGVEELVENLKKSHAGQFEVAARENGAAMKRTGIKKLEDAAQAEDVPQTLEEAIAQKYSGEEE